MMRYAFLIAGLTAALAAVQIASAEFDDRWYVAPGLGAASFDGDRLTESSDHYYSLSFGRFFTPRFSLDLRADRYSTDVDRQFLPPTTESGRFSLTGVGLVGRYHFLPEASVRPYLLAGVGIQEHSSLFDSGRDIYGSGGLGVMARLGDRMSLRLEGEGRYDNDRDTRNSSSGFVDYLVSASLLFQFGEPPRPPAPEPAPEPRRPAPPPEPAPEPPPEPEVLIEFDSAVTFAFDSAQLRPEARAELNEAVALLNQQPELRRVEVAGHTCDLGPADYNQGLSERRAMAVADYLVANGIARERLVVRGFGESQPKVANTSEENRAQNRRVVLSVLERGN